ncbi:MAG TPA: lactate utilization protein [Bacillota bacterium]|nr:lactate utilization protein [Bacillota bacterium]
MKPLEIQQAPGYNSARGEYCGYGKNQGSITLRQLGLVEALEKRGHVLYNNWHGGKTAEERKKTLKSQMGSDVFLTSTNAVTVDGKLVNTDFTGNRVASMVFGPEKIVVVAGANKIVADLQAAFNRIKNEAAPKNCIRLGFSTPCAGNTLCANCSGPHRLCRVTAIIEVSPKGIPDYTVIIVSKNLGY